MRAFCITNPGQEVGWLDKPVPEIGPWDALARPIAVAPCTSDIHNAYEVGPLRFLRDRVLGHEALAEIVEVGSEVTEFKAGDRVVVPPVTPDWRNPIIEDSLHQHNKRSGDAFKLAYTIDGVFAEYFVIPDVQMNAAFLPEGVSLAKALMACDMVNTGFHGVEMADVKFGESVAVMGLGPIGLMAVAGSVLRGAGRVYVVESKQREDRIRLAFQYGATDLIDFTEMDVVEEFKHITGKWGVDKVIVTGGTTDTFQTAVKIVKPGGTVANTNIYTQVDTLPVPMAGWGFGIAHKKLVGGLCPGGRRRMEKLLAMIEAGRVDPSPLITHSFQGLEKVEEAFYLMRDKPPGLIKPAVFFDSAE